MQKVSFKFSGADISKLRTLVNAKTNQQIVDFTDWQKSSTAKNAELLDILDIEPIYSLITDPVKKAEVKHYIDTYIAERTSGGR